MTIREEKRRAERTDLVVKHLKASEEALARPAEAGKSDEASRAAAAAYTAFVEALDAAALRLGLPISMQNGIIDASEKEPRGWLGVDCLCSPVLSILYIGPEPNPDRLRSGEVRRITSLAEEAACNLSSIARGGTIKDRKNGP